MPTLTAIGAGLLYFAGVVGNLVLMGAGICVGFWLAKKATNAWDRKIHLKLASKAWKKHNPDSPEPEAEQVKGAVAAAAS